MPRNNLSDMNDDYRYDTPYGEKGREFSDGRPRLGYYPDPWHDTYRRSYIGPPMMPGGDYHSHYPSPAPYYRGVGSLPVASYPYGPIPSSHHDLERERRDSTRKHESRHHDRSADKRHKHKSSKHRHKRSKHHDERSKRSKRTSPNVETSSDDNMRPALDHSRFTLGAEVRGKAHRHGDGHSGNAGSDVAQKSRKRTRSRTPDDCDAKPTSPGRPSRNQSSSSSPASRKGSSDRDFSPNSRSSSRLDSKLEIFLLKRF